MQGTSPTGRRSGWHFVLVLAVAHVLAAGLLVFVLAQVALLTHGLLAAQARAGIVAAASLVGVIVDGVALRRRGLSFGLARQTPKALQLTAQAPWVAPLFWGVDTGLIWTTYRVSFCSWLLLILAVLGIAPMAAGIVYGLAFAVPLLVVMGWSGAPVETECQVRPPRLLSPRAAQGLGLASMLLLAGAGAQVLLVHG